MKKLVLISLNGTGSERCVCNGVWPELPIKNAPELNDYQTNSYVLKNFIFIFTNVIYIALRVFFYPRISHSYLTTTDDPMSWPRNQTCVWRSLTQLSDYELKINSFILRGVCDERIRVKDWVSHPINRKNDWTLIYKLGGLSFVTF